MVRCLRRARTHSSKAIALVCPLARQLVGACKNEVIYNADVSASLCTYVYIRTHVANSSLHSCYCLRSCFCGIIHFITPCSCLWEHELADRTFLHKHELRHLATRRTLRTELKRLFRFRYAPTHTNESHQGPHPWADPKGRSTLGFCNRRHRSTEAQNSGILGVCLLRNPELLSQSNFSNG